MKPKSECCEKYRRKSNACKRCPLVAGLDAKRRRKRIKKMRKKLQKAA
jgi:hypothetical protein